jgi:hypothetical protein
LYFTKNKETFILKNYKSVVFQKGVSQDIYVVSAEPLDLKNNIVVSVMKNWPVPIKIGFSFNMAIRKVSLNNYTHIFKVDGDVILPDDYLINLLAKKAPVSGIGAAFLISVSFFKKFLKSKYPISYCDDGYISALAISLGVWPPKYDGTGNVLIPPVKYYIDREFMYGSEYYKWGMPLWFIIFLPFVSLIIRYRLKRFEYRSFKANLFNLTGYISAFFKREKKYYWWKGYSKYRTLHFISKFLSLKKYFIT